MGGVVQTTGTLAAFGFDSTGAYRVYGIATLGTVMPPSGGVPTEYHSQFVFFLSTSGVVGTSYYFHFSPDGVVNLPLDPPYVFVANDFSFLTMSTA